MAASVPRATAPVITGEELAAFVQSKLAYADDALVDFLLTDMWVKGAYFYENKK